MSTVVPLVLWGNEPPSHHVTCMAISPAGQEVATGCRSGFICLWSLSYRDFARESTDHLSGQKISSVNNFQAHAKSILVGASEQIAALCYSQDGTMLFSASSNGEIIRWDSMDGACTHQVILEGTHRGLKYLGNPQIHHLLLVFGNYSKAYLLDATTLDLAIVLNSEEQPNWISAMLPIPLSLHQKETHVLGITAEPLIKIWDVPRLDIQFPESDCKEEDKSRHTDLKNVLHITHWPKLIAQRLLIVGASYFKVLGVRAKSQLPELCHVACLSHVFSLSGGDFVDDTHIIVWSQMASAHLYSFLPTAGSDEKFVTTYLRCFQSDPSAQLPMDACWDLLHLEERVLLVQGNVKGTLLMWEPELDLLPSPEEPHLIKTYPDYTTSLQDAWDLMDKKSGLMAYLKEVLLTHSPISPSHIPDDVVLLESSWVESNPSFADNISISSILYIPELAKVMCGLNNGYVVIFPLVKTLERIVFGATIRDVLVDDVIVLKAHRGRVSALLYPRQNSEQFNSKYVLTGGADGAVRVWDIENRLHLHCFMEHTGDVLRLKLCPKMTNTRLNCGVCSIGQDYSVAILSLSDFREVLLCGNHSAPVTHVRWKTTEDLMLVRCKDGHVYIWQMDTGVLDRIIIGSLAQEIITNNYAGGLSTGQRRESTGVKIPKVGKNSQINTKNIASLRTYRSHPFDPVIPALFIHMEPLIDQLTYSDHVDKQVSKVTSASHDLDLSSSPTRPSPYDRRQETAFFTRLLISCLHSWGMDSKLDDTCKEFLRIRLPLQFAMYPQYGLMSKYSCISLNLPGWGLERSLLKPRDTPISSFPLSYKWCLSPGLTTQHLLALTSLSYCCMNLYSKKQLRTSSTDDTCERKLTACSQLNTLTCVFLPEMLGDRFSPPHLSVLALKWPHHNGQIREAAQALLLAQLRSISYKELQKVVAFWYQRMPPQPIACRDGVKGITYGNKEVSNGKPNAERRSSKVELPPLGDYLSDPEAVIKAKDYFTALIILSVIAAEFTDYGQDFSNTPSQRTHRDILTKVEIEHVALSLQGILCCPPSSSCSLQGALRRTAAELIAKGFSFFCKYLDVPSVLMSLFEITVTQPVNTVEETLNVDYQLARSTSLRSLTNIFQARADEMIDVLAKEVSTYTHFIGSTHSLIPVPGHEHQEPDIAAGVSKSGLHLLPRARKVLLKILEELLKKRLPHVFLKIVEFMQLVIFCVGTDELRNHKIEERFPAIDKLGCYAQCVRTHNLVVGRKSGYIGLFDLKHNKLQEFVGHSSPVTCLTFSIDGKYLCSYSQGSSEVRLWHVSTPPPILGQMVNPTVKLIKTVLATTPSDSLSVPPLTNHNNFRLFWLPKFKVLLMGENPKTEIELSFS